MKKTLIFVILMLFAGLLFAQDVLAQANPKYNKWNTPSYFRGYNVLYESPKTLEDFIAFKNYGGNFFHIQPDGFMAIDPPYGLVQADIDGCDRLVDLCRQAGIYYAIGMRSGPGAYDTFDESQQTVPESRIWNTGNTVEQQKYAEMLQMVVQRYANDTLFVGINMVVEPRPKVRMIPANTSALYKTFLENVYNIHMDDVYNGWIAAIRAVDPNIPIIAESFGYSTPELFPAYELSDPFIVYSAHNYQPVEFSKAEIPLTMTYPGLYWNITHLSQQVFNAQFLRETVFLKLRQFQQTTGAPVFIGEMGMFKAQIGGEDYLGDQFNIFKDYGWHFALWDWRRKSGDNWSIEHFTDPGSMHWKKVLSHFNAPPVPVLRAPYEGAGTYLMPEFTWDTLTRFTSFELEIRSGGPKSNLVATFDDLTSNTFALTDSILTEGRRYSWKVRSKNPGGSEENNSAWSEARYFTVHSVGIVVDESESAPVLKQNWPNPFNPSTNISFNISKNSFVKLVIYDILGREVANLVNKQLQQGSYSELFNASALPSGVYIYRLEAVPYDGSSSFTQIKRMVLVK